MASFKKRNHDSVYTHLIRCCDKLGIPDAAPPINKMLAIDYIIANEDRHYNNFGFVRNADTLVWLGAAPIYDSGTSLWYETLHIGSETGCKPFKKTHSEQIKIVGDLSWFNADPLKNIGENIEEVFSPSPDIDAERRTAIANAVINRINAVERLSHKTRRLI
jgi:hypothetical protein